MAEKESTPQISAYASIRQIEDHWTWKAGLRAFTCVANIIAIGAAAGLLATTSVRDAYLLFDYFDFQGYTAGTLVVLSVSTIWCALWIVIPLLLKPRRALHPGVAVGLDLVLWLAFLVVALFTLFGVYSIAQFGSNPAALRDISYGSSYDGYYLAPNNTWVYNATSSSSSSFNNDYSFAFDDGTTQTTRDCSPDFASCAEQDAWINRLWHDNPRKLALEILVDAVCWLDILLHFTLFVWACVDTQRRNNTKSSKAMQLVADKIIADLERKGIVRVENGQVMRADGPAEPYTLESSSPLRGPTQPQQIQPAPHMSGAVTGDRNNDTVTAAV